MLFMFINYQKLDNNVFLTLVNIKIGLFWLKCEVTYKIVPLRICHKHDA